MPSWGFLLLLFPWERNLTPIASVTQLLNQEIVYIQGTAEKQQSNNLGLVICRISRGIEFQRNGVLIKNG